MAKKIGLELVIGLVDEATSGLQKITGGLKGLAVVGGAAAAAGIVAVGKAAWEAGQQYDEAIDTIIAKTGATGATLDGLGADFKAVFTSIPTDAATAAGALAELNQKTGLTGPTLQGVTAQVLEMTRLLGGDASQNAAAFGETLNKWGIPAADAAGALDGLFVAAQQTGVGVDTLMEQVTRFAAPLQGFGYGFTEAAATVAAFEAAGINTQQAMSGLTKALGDFATAGEDPLAALEALVEQIKTAGSDSEATALAVDNFGAKAGPELAGAIRAGRLSVTELTAAMRDSEGAIMTTADATSDWGERWQIVKNRLTTALEPIGTKMLELATTATAQLGPALDWVTQHADQLAPVLGVAAALIGGALVAAFLSWAAAAWAAAAGTLAALAPVLGVIVAVGAAVALLVAAWQNNWGGIRDTLTAVWEGTLRPALETIGAWLGENIPRAVQTVSDFWNNTLLPALTGVWEFIQTHVLPIFDAIGAWLGENIPRVIETARRAWNEVLLPALELVRDIIEQKLLPVMRDVGAWLGEHIPPVIETAKQAWVGLWEKLQPIVDVLRQIVDWLGDKLRGPIEDVKKFLGDIVIPNPFAALLETINGIIDRAGTAISRLREFLGLGGGSAIGGHATGVHSFAGGLTWVGEAGPELVRLPMGSRIYSAGGSQRVGTGGATFVFQFQAPAGAYDERRIEAAVERGMLRAGVRADVLRRTR